MTPNTLESEVDLAVVVDLQSDGRERFAQTRPERAQAGGDVELCAMGRADDVPARAVEVGVLAPGHGRVVVGAGVAVGKQPGPLAHHEHRVLPHLVRVKAPGRAVGHLVNVAKLHGLWHSVVHGAGAPKLIGRDKSAVITSSRDISEGGGPGKSGWPTCIVRPPPISTFTGKAMVESAAQSAHAGIQARYDMLNPVALKQVVAAGVRVKAFPKPVLDAAFKASNALCADLSRRNPAWRRIYADYSAFRREQNLWHRLPEAHFDRYMQSARI